MARFTAVVADDVIIVFAVGGVSVVASLAATDHVVMVHLKGGPPCAVIVALVTLVAAGDMLWMFAGGIY